MCDAYEDHCEAFAVNPEYRARFVLKLFLGGGVLALAMLLGTMWMRRGSTSKLVERPEPEMKAQADE